MNVGCLSWALTYHVVRRPLEKLTGRIIRSIATMDIIRIVFAFTGAATMLAVIAIAIFGRDDDRLNEGLLIGIYVGAFGSISVLFVLRYLGLF